MSKQQPQSAEPSPPGEREVAAYLREHPDFFERYEFLLLDLRLPHPETGDAVSLVERQVAILREQRQELKRKLQALSQAARTNEALLERIEGLIMALIDSPTLEQVITTLDRTLREDFHADMVGLRLLREGPFQGRTRPDTVPTDEPGLRAFVKVLAGRQPVCGYLSPEQARFLFGERAQEVGSGAIIPLCDDEETPCLGVLGIGSIDPKRFHPEMGTVFLAHLGAVTARILRRRGR